jgi:hypothetical protein
MSTESSTQTMPLKCSTTGYYKKTRYEQIRVVQRYDLLKAKPYKDDEAGMRQDEEERGNAVTNECTRTLTKTSMKGTK